LPSATSERASLLRPTRRSRRGTRSKGKAALYLRSSKDRSDVSIDAQRRELVKLADERDLAIVTEFTDVVESGKDENRPGFQELIAAVRSRSRDWSTLLLLDTSRLTRRRHLAVLFEHEAERRGVKVLYRTVPETDAITDMLLRSILQAIDEWHSLTSRR
jgi:DNA invertase Pin-like site-specific DNA recombinase